MSTTTMPPKEVAKAVNEQSKLEKAAWEILLDVVINGREITGDERLLFERLGFDRYGINQEVERIKAAVRHYERLGTPDEFELACAEFAEAERIRDAEIEQLEEERNAIQDKINDIEKRYKTAERVLHDRENARQALRNFAPPWVKREHELIRASHSHDPAVCELREVKQAVNKIEQLKRTPLNEMDRIILVCKNSFPKLVQIREFADGSRREIVDVERFKDAIAEEDKKLPALAERLQELKGERQEALEDIDNQLDWWCQQNLEELKR